MTPTEHLDRDTRYLWHPWSPKRVTPETVVAVAGDGCEVVDIHGRRYLDAKSSGLNATLGYGCRPVIEAAGRQLSTLMTYDLGEGASLPSALLAERIAHLAGPHLTRTFLCGSGSEAVEAALRVARFHHAAGGRSDRTVVVSLDRAYHGSTLGAAAATGVGLGSAGPPGFLQVPTPGRGGVSTDESLEALERTFARHGGRIAAFLVEPVSARTAHPLPDSYLSRLRELCTDHGALLIHDEVTTGFGRVGTMFTHQANGVTPDMVCTSKGLGAGYASIGALTTTEAVFRRFETSKGAAGFVHGHTHSGHATACATALAVLTYLDEHDVLSNVRRRGAQIGAGLARLDGHPRVSGIHGRGLLLGIGLATPADAAAVREQVLARDVLVRRTGRTILIAPPLIIDERQAARILRACAEAVARLPRT